MFNLSIMCIAREECQECRRIAISPGIQNNGPMKNLGLSLLVIVVVVSCAPDRTLETLLPREVIAVAVVEEPSLLSSLAGFRQLGLPWGAVDGHKPWALAVLPGAPPGLLVAVALADKTSAWPEVQSWARDRGGLRATLVGSYAVMSSPNGPAPGRLPPGQSFDLAQVRVPGEPFSAYVNVRRLASGPTPPGVASLLSSVPGLARDLEALHGSLRASDEGVLLTATTEWVAGASIGRFLRSSGPLADLGPWSGPLGSNEGFAFLIAVPPRWFSSAGGWLADPELSLRWETVSPFLGPRVLLQGQRGLGGAWAWSAEVESQDPQAIHQALKTLVASGELQRHFGTWALDPDTPFLLQDKPRGRAITTEVSFGPSEFYIDYGTDRLTVRWGPGSDRRREAPATVDPSAARWFGQVPRPLVLFSGGIDGSSSRGSLQILPDGNLELRAWVTAAEVPIWEAKLPEAILSWLSATKGSSLGAP